MTTSSFEDPDRTDEVIVTVPLKADAKVASLIRPPRPITRGRRQTDRYLTISIIVLIWFFMAFTIYVGIQIELLREALGK